MSNKFTTGRNGLDLIKSFEGLKLTAYLCPARIPTIGFGHTKTVRPDDVGKKKITENEAERLLKADLVNFESSVNKLVKVPLNQNQFDALVSFAFNVGSGALSTSTLLKKLNAKDYKGAADQFARWNKAGGKVLNGLVRRRAAEAALFNRAVK